MDRGSVVVEKFENAITRSRAKEWDYLPGVIRGSALLPATATSDARYNLFSLNRGGLGNNTWLSNIVSSAGVMPSDQSFLVEGLKFSFVSTVASASANDLSLNNVRQLLNKSTFTLLVDGKPKTEGWLLSLGIPVVMWGAGTVAIDLAINTVAFKNISHNPIGIPPGVSFDVEMIITNPTLTASSTYVTCELIGTRKVRLG